MLVEEIDQFREVGQRAGEAVDLVDDDDVDLSQTGWPRAGAGEPAGS